MKRYDTIELTEILRRIDDEAMLQYGTGQRFSVVVVGGSALMLSELTERRATRDIDLMSFDDPLTDIVARHRQLSSEVAIYADRLPRGFETRMQRMPVETRVVDFYCPCQEDLAVMKLYSWRKQDQLDLLSPQFLESLDMELLDHLVHGEDGAKASSLTSLTYKNMVNTYDKKFKPRALLRLQRLKLRKRLRR